MNGRIDGTGIYLNGDQLPAFTLSLNDLTDPSKIRGARSTTLRLTNTKEVRRVFSTQPMRVPSRADDQVLRIGDGGVDLYRATVVPVNTDRNEVEAIAVGGNASWFDYAKRTKLREFDFGQSGTLFGDDMAATWTDAESLLYFPLVDFGALELRAATFNVLPERLRPAFRAHRVINEALAPAGYTMQPRGRLAKYWHKLVIMQPTDKVRTADFYGNPHGAVLSGSAALAMPITTLGTAPAVYLFGLEVEDPDNRVGGGLTYTMGPEGTIDVRASMIAVDFDPFSPPPVGEIFTLTLYDATAGAALATYSQAYTSGDTMWFNHTFEGIAVPNGNEIYFGVQKDPGSTYTDPYYPSVYARGCFSPADALYSPQFYPYGLGYGYRPIVINSAMPSLTLMDLITALSNDQCLAFVTNAGSGVIEVWEDREYFRKPAAGMPWRDWRGRIDHTSAPAKVVDDNPIRVLFRFAEDDGDETALLLRESTPYPELGNADFINPRGYGKETEVSLPFAASAMDQLFGLSGCRVPVMRAKDGAFQVDDFGRTMRLLVADGLATGNWTFNFSSRTTYPRCYFTDPSDHGTAIHFDTATAGYPGTVARNWADRLRRLRDSRVLDCTALLRDSELQDFDHGVPTLVDDGSGPAWYYVQEISGHQFGQNKPTRVLLVEIPGTWVDADAVTPAIAPITYPEFPPDPPPFIPPCLNAPMFPSTPVAVSYTVVSANETACTADTVTYPIGMRLLITGTGGGGGTNWDNWTGSVVQRVAPGTGTNGSTWQRFPLADGTIVRDYNQPVDDWAHWHVVCPFPAFASGQSTAWWMFTPYMDTGGTYGFYGFNNVTGEAGSSDYPTDACRRYVMQVNTTTDPVTGWTDLPGTERDAYVGDTYGGSLAGVLYYRAKYLRGNNVQGYSERTAI